MKKTFILFLVFMFGALSLAYAIVPPSTSLEESTPTKSDLKQDLKKIEDRLETDLGDLKSLTTRLSSEEYSHGN